MKLQRQLTSVAQQMIVDYTENRKGLIAVDATVGNGNDTLFLAQYVKEIGTVYGFDIQQIAIDTTKKKLQEAGFNENIHFIRDSHENIDKYIAGKIDIAMFNLGYLPIGDKSIVTHTESTISAIEKAILQLSDYGIITILCYPGHLGGNEESEAVYHLLKQYSPRKYTIGKIDIINTKGVPPILYIVVKVI